MLKRGIRFITIGILSNVILFSLYLLSTSSGIGHKTAMTLLYAVGIAQSFFLNKRWTFSDCAPSRHAFVRYCTIYLLGYLLNYAILALFVDKLHCPHQYVQGLAIILVASVLFFLQIMWVFPDMEKAEVG